MVERLKTPVVEKTENTVKNSHAFAEFVRDINLDANHELGSFDVVFSLHQNTSRFSHQSCKKRLSEDVSLNKKTTLPVEFLIDLLSFCLNTTYFVYDGTYYQQVFGTAMCSLVSAVIANLVMEDIEQRALVSSPVTPLFWKRYVDDVISAVSRNEVENLLNHLNSVEPSIQFIVERENEGQLSFLDLNIYRKDQGLLGTGVHRKSTHTDKYLAFDSHHPICIKNPIHCS